MSDLASMLDELATAPAMPAARCAGRHSLYDATIEATGVGRTAAGIFRSFSSEENDLRPAAELAQARTEALRLCSGCPELARCSTWLDSLPKKARPRGVIAGRLITGRVHKSRPRKPTKGVAA